MTKPEDQDQAELTKIADRLSKRPAPNYSDAVRRIAGKLKTATTEDAMRDSMKE